ncbi:MAG: site-specific DNA-methyltransferase, partial [Bacteroidia bacterium]
GDWDRSRGFVEDVKFHRTWIAEVKRILKDTGTIWISGTLHNIYQCGFILQEQGFHLLNDICWYKPNAAPNLSCTTFAHAHETLLWAKKNKRAKHYFAYDLMKKLSFPDDPFKNEGKQMRSVWSIPTPLPAEKKYGKHPAQKPIALLKRILLASTKEGDVILDPFMGAGTTAVAVALIGERYFIGIEKEAAYLEIARKRLEEVISQTRLL